MARGRLDFRPWTQRVCLPWSVETPKALLEGNPGCGGNLAKSRDVICSASKPVYARCRFSRGDSRAQTVALAWYVSYMCDTIWPDQDSSDGWNGSFADVQKTAGRV